MRLLCAIAIIATVLIGGSVAIAETHVVTVGPGGSMTFSPSTLTIANGDTVRWEWDSSGHTVTSGTPGAATTAFNSGLNGAGAVSVTGVGQRAGNIPSDYVLHNNPNEESESPGPKPIPTIGEWGVILTGILLLFVGAYFIRRQRQDGAPV